MLDNTDIEILKLLQENARETIKSIGDKVGLSAPAAAERIKKLEQDNVITGYHATVNAQKFDKQLEAFILVNVSREQEKAFYTMCETHGDIISYYRIIGTYGAMLHVYTQNSITLETMIDEIKQWGITQTSVVLPKGSHTKVFK